jgi:hypothetical protein
VINDIIGTCARELKGAWTEQLESDLYEEETNKAGKVPGFFLVSREMSYKRVSKNSAIFRGRKPGVNPLYKSVLFDDIFLTFILALPIMNQ